MEKTNYISFIDILGTKDYATYQPDKYIQSIIHFQNGLISNVDENLTEEDRVYFFSDGAFIESPDIIRLVKYLRAVRSELSPIRLYFKGAITKGTLGAISGFREETEKIAKFSNAGFFKETEKSSIKKIYENISISSIENKLTRASKIINGTMFLSRDVSTVFSMQDKLKGIGILIDSDIVDLVEEYAVKSFYLSSVLSNNVITFYDICLNKEEEISEEIFKQLLKDYLNSNTKSKKYGRYFLSSLATWISSTDFSAIDKVTDEKGNTKLKEEPFILKFFLNMPRNSKALYDKANGLSFLYFHLINKIYEQCYTNDDTTYYILERLLKLRKIFSKYLNDFDSIQDDIISRSNKVHFMSNYQEILAHSALDE